MASLHHAATSFSGTSASDLLRSSCNGVNGIPLKALGRAPLSGRGREFSVVAKIKKGKKHDNPWPKEIDPNVKGGPLSYLSSFKPLNERPKPVTLEFEKPLRDLEKKIVDIRKMADETGLDFSDQILSLESKYQQALKDLYTHLTPIQRLNIARHPNRPTFLDHVLNITEKWVELHGDRAGYDDPAIVTGIGRIDGRSYMFIGHQKGRNTKENIARNFGMPTPHGYRKALRMMYYADHHGFPIITFIDTPGAFADLKSEELGQGEAIAHNLRTMYGLKVPIVTVVIGEGGSGGALAIGCANKLLMLENAVFYVASSFDEWEQLDDVPFSKTFISGCPEACAAILWKSAKASPKAAEKLKITATELCRLKIADGIIPEPLGGAHTDPSWTSQQIKIAVMEAMNELREMDIPNLLQHRYLKFRSIGGFQEGVPQDPVKKINMKKRDQPIIRKAKIPDAELADEVEKLKQQVLKAKEASSPIPELGLNEMIGKLRKEVDREFYEAIKLIGMSDKLEMLQKEVQKVKNSQEQLVDPSLKEKIQNFQQDFNKGLSQTPYASSISYKLDMLKEITKAKKISEQDAKLASLKQEINKGLKEVMDRSNMKERIEKLQAEIGSARMSGEEDLGTELREKILKLKKEISLELADVLKSLHLNVEHVASRGGAMDDLPVFSHLKGKVEELTDEINDKIKDVVSSTDLKNKIEILKSEMAKAGKSPDPESTKRIESLRQEIKQSVVHALEFEELIDKHETLRHEIAMARESLTDESEVEPSELNGSLSQEALKEDGSKHDIRSYA